MLPVIYETLKFCLRQSGYRYISGHNLKFNDNEFLG
jgi:hypothetical protein